MTDIRADDPALDDRLPWLEAVEDDDKGSGPSALKLIVAVLIGLVAIGGIVGGIFWLGNRGAAHRAGGEPELIKAPHGAYKVRPDDPGGMTVEGEGDTAFAASAGADPKGTINPNAVPEAPVKKGEAPQQHAQAQPQPQPTQPVQAKPQPKAAEKDAGTIKAPAAANGPSGSIQLGAFSSEASAQNAWKALSGRFGYLAPLGHSVATVTANGKTLYRLRASGAGAHDVCGRLKVAGETCVSLD